MNGLLLFVFIVTVCAASYFVGERIGYLRGRAEMAAEPITVTVNSGLDEEAIEKELAACGKSQIDTLPNGDIKVVASKISLNGKQMW